MFVLLFLLWLVLNGGWSLQIAGAGALAAGLVAWGCQRTLGLPFWGGRKLWQGILRAVGYLPLLLREVWTANLQVILRILCPGRRGGGGRPRGGGGRGGGGGGRGGVGGGGPPAPGGGGRRGAPRLSWMDPGLREPGTQFLLANSITLTPGTVTVALHGGRLCVYALDQEFAAGIKDSEFVRRLRRWEGKQDG